MQLDTNCVLENIKVVTGHLRLKGAKHPHICANDCKAYYLLFLHATCTSLFIYTGLTLIMEHIFV